MPSAVLAALCPLPAYAQSAATDSPGASSGAILQMLLGLAVIIAILFVGAYLVRQMNGGRRFGHTGPLKIVGGLMISPRERILLVEVAGNWLVIGVVPGQIKTLHTLPKGELPANASPEAPFGQWLKHFTERNHESR